VGLGTIPLDRQLVCLDKSVVSRTPLSCSVGLCQVPGADGSRFKVRLLPFAVAHTALVLAVKKDSAAAKCVASLGGAGGAGGAGLTLPEARPARYRWPRHSMPLDSRATRNWGSKCELSDVTGSRVE